MCNWNPDCIFALLVPLVKIPWSPWVTDNFLRCLSGHSPVSSKEELRALLEFTVLWVSFLSASLHYGNQVSLWWAAWLALAGSVLQFHFPYFSMSECIFDTPYLHPSPKLHTFNLVIGFLWRDNGGGLTTLSPMKIWDFFDYFRCKIQWEFKALLLFLLTRRHARFKVRFVSVLIIHLYYPSLQSPSLLLLSSMWVCTCQNE